MTKTFSTWMQRIGQESGFLDPKLKDMSDQSLILDRDRTIHRLSDAIARGEHIVAYSDYDCDGMGSAVIIVDAIRQMGGRITPIVASRFAGGYGLNDISVDRILQLNPTVVITLDCGSSDHRRIERLNAAGIDCMVVDHHLVPEEKLPAFSFINPHRPECKSQYKWMCSAGLTLSLVGGLRRHLGVNLDTSQFLDICAISTIADVAPLTLDNRALVRAGLEAIANTQRPGLKALMQLAKFTPGQPITGRDVAFRIAPLMNAPGRLGPADVVVNLLLSRDPQEVDQLTKEVEELTSRRRLLTDTMTCESVKQVLNGGFEGQPALVLGDESWCHGIVGIVAARIVEKYNVPVCVVGSGGHGSLRGPPGSRLHDALIHCKDHLLKYGGHQAAAGCTIQFDQLENFRQAFCNFFTANSPIPPENSFSEILELDLSDNCLKLVEELATLEPCGQGNPRPKIQIEGKAKGAKSVKGDHLKLDVILTDSRTIGCFAIGKGALADEINGKKVKIIGDLRKNEWLGKVKAEIFVETIHVTP